MIDFCVEQPRDPEAPARIGEILGAAGVNIAGLCLTACQERCIIHFVVEDAATTRRALDDSGIEIRSETEVFVLSKDGKGITGQPGSFGPICRMLAEHGITIRFAYPGENNMFFFGVDDVAEVGKLLG